MPKITLIRFCLLIFKNMELFMSRQVVLYQYSSTKRGHQKEIWSSSCNYPCLSIPKHYQGGGSSYGCPSYQQITFLGIGVQSPMQEFSHFFPDFHTSNNLTLRIFGCVSFVHIHARNRGNQIHGHLNAFLLSILRHKRVTHVIIHLLGDFVFADVAFVEKEGYFTDPYLQGKTSFTEDKDKKKFLFDLPSTSQSSSSNPTFCTMPSPTPATLPIVELSSFDPMSLANKKSTYNPTRPLQVYLKRQAPIVELVQIQQLEPTPRNEVISLPESSHDNVSTTIDNGDHDLPIALWKGTRECIKHLLYPLSYFVTFKRLSPSH